MNTWHQKHAVLGAQHVPVGAPVEIVANGARAQDTVVAWLALEQRGISGHEGAQFFSFGLPCRRQKIRDAQTRPVFVDGADAAWDDHFGGDSLGGNVEDTTVEEREISPALYSYEAPSVLAELPAALARWAYETFKAAEFDAMYRLRDDVTPWAEYVEELRSGMEKQKR